METSRTDAASGVSQFRAPTQKVVVSAVALCITLLWIGTAEGQAVVVETQPVQEVEPEQKGAQRIEVHEVHTDGSPGRRVLWLDDNTLAQDPDEPHQHQHVVITIENGKGKILVDGKQVSTVEIDGKTLRADNLHFGDEGNSNHTDLLYWLDKHGNAAAGTNYRSWLRGPVGRAPAGEQWFDPQRSGNEAFHLASEPPRFIIGINMGAVNEVVAAHLGLDAEDCFMVTEVLDGHPAQRAGIRKHDIVTSINGDSHASGERLREVLRGVGADARVHLGILRKGQPIVVEVGVTRFPAADNPNPGAGNNPFAATPLLKDIFPGALRDTGDQLKRIEHRLDRIEEMLEQLLHAQHKKIEYADDFLVK